MLIELIELASNTGLQHDPDTLQRMQNLQGKTMLLEISSIDQQVYVTPRGEELELAEHMPESVDVTLRASIPALLKLSRDGIDNVELEPGELEIIGDPIVGQRFAKLVSQISIDWEALVSERIGPAPAKFLGMALEQAKDAAQVGRDQLQQMSLDLIHDEFKLVAESSEVEKLGDDVDDLSSRVSVLEARIAKLLDRNSDS